MGRPRFHDSIGVQESKQGVAKVVSLVKNRGAGGYTICIRPLNQEGIYVGWNSFTKDAQPQRVASRLA